MACTKNKDTEQHKNTQNTNTPQPSRNNFFIVFCFCVFKLRSDKYFAQLKISK